MDICLDIVSFVTMVVFSPYIPGVISRGVHKEVKLAEHQNTPIYLLFDNVFYNYVLGDTNENDWRNFCPYNYISLITGEVFFPKIFDNLAIFFTNHKNDLLREIRDNTKKIIVISNTTSQSDFVIKSLHKIFSSSFLNILPILGKSNLCTNEHVDNTCISHSPILNTEPYNFFTDFSNNLFQYQYKSLLQLITISVPENMCPYATLYDYVSSANIIVLNKVFFKSIRLRTKLRQDIIFDNPRDFILVLDNIKDLFHDYTENKCSDNDLREAYTILKNENDSGDHKKAVSIIKKLLALREGELIEVEYFLSEFLFRRHQKLEIDPDPLESIFDICKTPFGQWKRQGNEILQIIDSSSLKRFLGYFYQVYFLSTDLQHINPPQKSRRYV